MMVKMENNILAFGIGFYKFLTLKTLQILMGKLDTIIQIISILNQMVKKEDFSHQLNKKNHLKILEEYYYKLVNKMVKTMEKMIKVLEIGSQTFSDQTEKFQILSMENYQMLMQMQMLTGNISILLVKMGKKMVKVDLSIGF